MQASILPAPESGEYIVQVRSDGVGFYSLSGGEPLIESEDNNTFETADEIALGEAFVFNASLTDGDVDFFRTPPRSRQSLFLPFSG